MEDKPLALRENWVLDDVAEIIGEKLREHGMYQIRRDAGLNFCLTNQRIGAAISDACQAELLEVAARHG